MTQFKTGIDQATQLDKMDPLKEFQKSFFIPKNCIYMDGNSLGLMPKDSEIILSRVLNEWKNLAVRGWLEAKQPWFHYAEEAGKMVAGLIGALPEEVVAAGSTTVNIHSLLSSFYIPSKKKNKILADALNFPSDIYAIKSHLRMRGFDPDQNLLLLTGDDNNFISEEEIIKNLSEDVVLVFLPSVLYQNAQLLDLPRITKEAHDRGICVGFDCSHSVGVVPHKFSEWGVDFAMWCSYKYLNAGPGSIAFIYVNKSHFEKEPMMAGWFGYQKDKQFDMSLEFEHQRGAGGWQISTPSILNLAVLEGSLKIFNKAGIYNIREKSLKMTEYLIFLIDNYLSGQPYNFSVVSPRNPGKRGGHIALKRKTESWRICEALKNRGIIPDFRKPDIIRFAPVALYNSYLEIWHVVSNIKDIIDNEEYKLFSEKIKTVS